MTEAADTASERGPAVVVLGGGMAGIGAAHALLRAGCAVEIVEAGPELGGLAGSFERDGAFYPLGYHHILPTDRTLRRFLEVAGVAPRVRWRRVRLLFQLDGGLHELGSAAGFLRFPISARAKLGLVLLALRAFLTRDWRRWEGAPATRLVSGPGGDELRRVVFDPLARLKFRTPLAELSAAWLGARLHAREGAGALGYVPGANWTKLLCDGLTRDLDRLGARLHLSAPARALVVRDGRAAGVELEDGRRLDADAVVSTVPVPVHRRLAPSDATPELARIRYTALLSTVCAQPGGAGTEFYWLNLSSLDRTSCAIFQLSSLNPTIGRTGETCLNFVTHLASAADPLFGVDDEELLARCRDDARAVLGLALAPNWFHVARVPLYSPIFDRDYRNPPLRSSSIGSLYYAGNYRTYPAVASTGTALASGLEASAALLADRRAAGAESRAGRR
jgi:protoporphyrinogen oxidase